jgi:hypothetical protein
LFGKYKYEFFAKGTFQKCGILHWKNINESFYEYFKLFVELGFGFAMA